MSDFQIYASIAMAFIIGFALGRSGRPKIEISQHEITQEEQAKLNPRKERFGDAIEDHGDDLLSALRSGQKLLAIKIYREQHNTSLKAAKIAVEKMIKKIK